MLEQATFSPCLEKQQDNVIIHMTEKWGLFHSKFLYRFKFHYIYGGGGREGGWGGGEGGKGEERKRETD